MHLERLSCFRINGIIMNKCTINRIITGIINRDSSTIKFIYNKYYGSIKSYVLLNNGDEEDAKDVFQESMIILYDKLNDNKFVLECSVHTFLYSVARYVWLKELRKRNRNVKLSSLEYESFATDDEFEEVYNSNQSINLFITYLEQLDAACKKIIQLYLNPINSIETTQI